MWDTRWRSWLRHCATCRKVAVSIPMGIHLNLSSRTLSLDSIESLTEMNITDISRRVKAAGA